VVIWAVCLRLNSDTFEFIFVVIVLQKAFFCFFKNLMGRGSAPHSLYIRVYIFLKYTIMCASLLTTGTFVFLSVRMTQGGYKIRSPH